MKSNIISAYMLYYLTCIIYLYKTCVCRVDPAYNGAHSNISLGVVWGKEIKVPPVFVSDMLATNTTWH